MDELHLPIDEAYVYVIRTNVIDILYDKKSRLFLESVCLLKDGIDIYYKYGADKAEKYLYDNIGG